MAERGEWRGIYTVLLDSAEFQDLTPEGQLTFFLVKLTLGPSGIELVRLLPQQLQIVSPRTAPARLSYGLAEMLHRGWLYRQGNVWWLRNGLRWDPTLSLVNEPHMKGVSKHLSSLPRLGIVQAFVDYYRGLGAKALEAPKGLPEWDPPSLPPWDPPPELSTDSMPWGMPPPMPPPMPTGIPTGEPPPDPHPGRERDRDTGEGEDEQKAGDKSPGASPPRSVENGGEKRLAFLMARVREHLYGEAGEPPRGRSTAQDASSIKKLLALGHTPDYLAEAMAGAAALREAGKLRELADPGEALSMGVFIARTRARPFLSEAHDAYLRTLEGRDA